MPRAALAASDPVPGPDSLDLTWVDWGPTDRPEPTLVARAPLDRDARVSFEVQARLAHLKFSWVEGPVTVAAGTTLELPLALPSEVFLDPLAATYLTRLVVFPSGAYPSPLPHVFVAWPSGPEAQPVVWSRAEADTRAPLGVLDAAVRDRAIAGDISPTWIEPPLVREGPREALPDRESPPAGPPEPDEEAP